MKYEGVVSTYIICNNKNITKKQNKYGYKEF